MSDLVGVWLLAHGPVGRGELWSAWARDPLPLLAIGALAVAYANGVAAARGRAPLRGLVRRRAACAAGAALVLLVALASPLEGAAGTLFSAHMVQHLLLSAVAAPLLVLAAPVATIRRGLPGGWTRTVDGLGRRLRIPASARRWWALPTTVAAVITMSVWHVPAAYDAALDSAVLHAVEHVTILGAGLLFWSAVVGAARRHHVLWAVAALAVASIHGGALGALLALSPEPWYDGHALGAASWGLDPLADQQVAGAIMWVPTAAIHLAAMAALVHRWLAAQPPGGAPTPPPRAAGAAGSAGP